MRVISWIRPARQQAISRPATPTSERCALHRTQARIEGWCFTVPALQSVLYINFIPLKVFLLANRIFTSCVTITGAIRKTEYDSQCGQRTLMSETAPLWSTTFYSNYLSDQLRKPLPNLRYLREHLQILRIVILPPNSAFRRLNLFCQI